MSAGAPDFAYLETLLAVAPVAVGLVDAELRFVRVNERLAELTGVPVAEHAGRYVLDVMPRHNAQIVRDLQRVLATGEPLVGGEVTGETQRVPGVPRTFRRSYHPVRDAGGRIIGVTAIVEELTEAVRAAAALREGEARLRAMFEQSPTSTVVYEAPSGVPVQLNAAFTRLWGLTIADVPPGYTVFDDRQLQEAGVIPLVRRAFAGETVTLPPISYDFTRVVGRGSARWTQAHLYPLRDESGAVIQVVLSHEDVTRRLSAESALVAARRDAEWARDWAEDALRFLGEAELALAGSLDVNATLGAVARLVVPTWAEWCTVDLLDDDGTPRQVAVAHRDPEKEKWARELRHRYPIDPRGDDSPFFRVLRSGRSELVAEIPDALVVAAARDDEHLAMLRSLGLRSALCVPLMAHGRTIGAMTLIAGARGRVYTDADRALVERLASRAALAVVNAQLYATEQAARRQAESAASRTARLQAVTTALSATLTPDDVGRVIIDHGLAALGARAGSVAVIDEDGATLRILGAVGYPAELLERFRSMALDADVPLAEAARRGEPIFLSSLRERAARYPGLGTTSEHTREGAIAAVPLAIDGRPLGALGISFPDGVVVTDEDRRFVLALAEQCAQALDRARLYAAEREARAEAETARRGAEAANLAKSQFLSTMSHELRTPLNAIAGYVDLMELGIRGPVTDEQRGDLARIKRSAQVLMGLVTDILNFARLEAGQVEFRSESVRLDEIAGDIEALIAPQLGARGIMYRCGAEAPCEANAALAVRADPERLKQVLLNLLTNAVKFTEAGGRVELAWGAVSSSSSAPGGDGHVRIRVTDTGRGIPADRLDQIFQPFVQVDRHLTQTSQQGVGLGLAISRDLARRMGGDLVVESELGRGSTFTLTLPRAPARA